MGVMTTSPDVVPEALRYLLRAVLAHTDARCNKSDLLLLVAPEGLPETMKPFEGDKPDDGDNENNSTSGNLIVTRSLIALTAFKLVSAEGAEIVATDTARRHWSKPSDVSARSLSRVLRSQLWQGATAGDDALPADPDSDLVNALAVLHAWPEPLRPFDFEGGSGRRFDFAQAHWYGPNKADWPITNVVQFAPFRRWAAYLGYAQHVGKQSVIAEASQALVADLHSLPRSRYRVRDFIDHCVRQLPISDGGSRTHWKPDDPREISPDYQ